MRDLPRSDPFGAAPEGQPARVVRTGIALVHEGELVFPAAGSEAEAELAGSDDRVVINYYFPVEIEVRGGPEPAASHHDDIRAALRRLADAFGNMA
ncbi:hypothetical protein [Aquisphaera insulae]|uniref:hypothetical protein n=1 Tax=Aquisphaera insulae TaxID=2712864 RepID=UPI0013EA88E5|nr:hypothetical protein [Aquisphaera insulae]